MQIIFTEIGQELLTQLQADRASGKTFAELNSIMRARGVSQENVAPLLHQAELQEKASKKFGVNAKKMLFTRDGLEQASRREITNVRAERYARQGVRAVADLGCGIGSQAMAFAKAGLEVSAVEIDEHTAKIAAHNLKISGSSDYQLFIEDAKKHDITPNATVFLDPARRDQKSAALGKRFYNPKDFSPDLDFTFQTAQKHGGAVKLGPAFAHDLIPATSEAEWVSFNGELLENVIWFGHMRRPEIERAATVIKTAEEGAKIHEMTASWPPFDAAISDLSEFIYEPDPAIIRSRMLGQLVSGLNASMLDAKIAYFTAEQNLDTPFAQAFQILEVLPFKIKQIAKALKAREIGRLEIKKRGVELDPKTMRQQLKLKGSQEATLVVTRIGEKRLAFITRRVIRPSAPRSQAGSNQH